MSEKRIQFNNIVQNQLPAYVRNEFPLISDFLKTYYQAQEFQSGPVDLIQNIDQYTKVSEMTNLTQSVGLAKDIDLNEETIPVDMGLYPEGTRGFPDSYGLLKIDDEIITYTGTATTCFTGCVRGFCGITSYKAETKSDVLVFNSSTSQDHIEGSKIENLSILFLQEFLLKTKHQLLPGLEDRKLTDKLNQDIFIKQAKDFYLSKGTDRSFEILFRALYDEDVRIIKPREFLFTPSNAHYKITNDLVVEPYEGNPLELENSTLFQGKYGNISENAYAPITDVEPIFVGSGVTFYKLSLDAGYNRDVRVDGSIYGEFNVQPTTQVISEIASGSTSFDVDSTVGFPDSGELTVSYIDGTIGVISYTSKSLTQFFGCSNLTATIPNATKVGINTFAYGTSSEDGVSTIKVRINSVLNSFDYPTNTHYYSKEEIAHIKTLGVSDKSFKFKNWFYNVAPIYKVKSTELIDTADKTYKIAFDVDHSFRIGDYATIIGAAGNSLPTSLVLNIDSAKSIIVKGQGDLVASDTYKIKRNISKVQSNTFPEAIIYSTNVQNVYKEDDSSKLLVASGSIPSYNSQPLNVSSQSIEVNGTFSGDEFQITTTSDHGFYTGDKVNISSPIDIEKYFDANGQVQTREVKSTCFVTEGSYFIKRVDANKIKLAKSRTNIYNSKFISLDNEITVVKNKIEPYGFKDKTLEAQDLLREFVPPIDDGKIVQTEPGFTGVLINGVEISNYKSRDSIYSGPIEGIEVLDPGSAYDVINPPHLSIADVVGTGATGYAAVSGVLESIKIIDPGFDYEEPPVVTITGGNGSGAVASVNMKLIDHQSTFNANATSIDVNLSADTIGFGTYHKFRNAEEVRYITQAQTPIGGITSEASYYISSVDSTTIKLHKTQKDAIAGISTINLTSHGNGKQFFKSINKKLVLESINVTSPGIGYENKKRTTNRAGISTSLNEITINNHGYSSGEIVKYTTTGAAAGGLVDNTEYYVTKIDNNKFKLSEVGAFIENKEYYYDTKQYVPFSTSGIGTHIFNYQDISVKISGKIGISSVGSETFEAEVQPIFRGEITSIHLENKGINYGSNDIINYNRQPEITLSSGVNAQLQPVVNNGQITEVFVLNAGSNYISPPNLLIDGVGTGAVLTPVLENNQIKSINVIEGGTGYIQGSTTVTIFSPGAGAEFNANIQSWRINLFERYRQSFTQDDGYIAHEYNEGKGLQYSHLYAPRKLRESVFGTDQEGRTLYGKKDLQISNGTEIPSTDHSPIIGWAYDGNPIYGPYGYTTKRGGIVSQMKTGYSLDLKTGRPPLSTWPEGFFIEDFTYSKLSDETVLDENNGRFCITPEFPKGTYAYFATINDGAADSADAFLGYKRPVFPYLVGDSYHSIPNEFNFNIHSNQTSYNLNDSKWLRNTQPYNLIEGDLRYEYAYIPNDLNQTLEVKAVAPGKIQKVGINTRGDLYRVNDPVVFDNTDTQGYGADTVVSRVLGKSISNVSVATSTLLGVELVPAYNSNKGEWDIYSTQPHNFEHNDLITISGLSTTSTKIEGSYKAGFTTSTFSLAGIGSTTIALAAEGTTGIVTYVYVSGNLNFSNIRDNDFFTMPDSSLSAGVEKVKVLKVEPEYSRIRILRNVDGGGTGSAKTITTVLTELPRKLTVNAGFNTTFTFKTNKELYFNPSETVALGATSGVGIGTTLSLSTPGVGLTEIFVPTKTFYLPKHQLETGDKVTYSTNIGSGISVQNEGGGTSTLATNQELYIAKIDNDLVGLATVTVGLNSEGVFVGIASTYASSRTLFFTGIGTGIYHSLKTNYDSLTGEIERNLVTVSSASTHGLISGNTVDINVNPSISTSVTVQYNDYNRKVIINPKSFIAAGVITSTNTITLADHGFVSGQKVIYTATTPSEGLSNNENYYIVKVDNNNFKLSTTYYNSTLLKPITVGISSASIGTINPINPSVKLYKDSTVTFNLSDSSLSYINQSTAYPAFSFNFYTDVNYTQLWDKSENSVNFEVTKTGIIGVSSDASVTLTVNKDIPEVLYYKLDPVFESDLPDSKKEIIVDNSVINNNEIFSLESAYNGKHQIAVGATNTFTYSLAKTPENVSYAGTTSILKYTTDSKTAYGPVESFEIKDGGRNYYSIPGITTITSKFGTGAVVSASSTSIGVIKRVKIDDIGYNFPSDTTLRPSVGLPQIVQLESLSSIESIGITSVGRGYTTAPELLVFDGKTNELVSDLDLKYTLGESQVTILKNTFGMSKVTPIVLPVKNSNGVGISTVGFNTITKDVTVTLSVGFSTINSFPFSVNDKILIEGVSVGIGSTGKGFNSSEYGYKLFTVTGTDENLGGIGIVTYSLANDLNGEVPGSYDSFNSSGRIIPQKYFPVFDVSLTPNDYLVGEDVKSSSATGTVEKWDSKNELLVIASKGDFKVNEVIEGLSSNTQGVASSITSYESNLKLGAFSRVENGWETDSGVLNYNLQRIQDSDYYQNFSYSLRSKVSYNTWDDVVSTLNHTLGHKKFSDYQLESESDNSMQVGLTTAATSFDVVNDLVGIGNLNCVSDFDLVKENSLNVKGSVVSDKIIFSSRILTDYEESIGNRVLSIDDMSGSFNSTPRATAFSVVNRFPLSTHRSQKYIAYIKDKRYYAQRQIMVMDLVHDESFGYMNTYGRVENVYDLGSFDFSILGSEGQLLWYPNHYTINDYDVTVLSYNLDDTLLSIGSSSVGPAVIKTSSTNVLKADPSTTVVSFATTYRSAKVLVNITRDNAEIDGNSEFGFEELNIVHDGSDVELMEYGEMTTTVSPSNTVPGFGTYSAYIDSSTVKVDFHPNTGIGTTAVINTMGVFLPHEITSGINTVDMKHARLEGRTTSIASTSTPVANVIGSYPDTYDAGYFIISVADATNNKYQLSELIVLDDYDGNPDSASYGTGETYEVEYGEVRTLTGVGTIGTRLSSSVVEVVFTPLAGIAVTTQVFMNALRYQDDDKDIIEFDNGTIETGYGVYYGTERDIKRSFNLTHKQYDIFQREFIGNDSSIVDVDTNTVSIPNHFFVTGEKIKYVHAGAGSTQAIGIAATNGFVGIGTTTELPSELFVVKIDENKVKIAETAQKALLSVPQTVDFTSVGIGTSHRFVATNQNAKGIICLDNIIQSPVVATAVTSSLSREVFTTDNVILMAGITSFFGGDLAKINEEIVKIEAVGVGTTNALRVRREWLGTNLAGHSTGALVTKVSGNYNIVDNMLNFVEAPFGNLPISSTTNPPDDRDWTGISTSSSFQGRTFMRSGLQDTSNDTYYRNYIFDDISARFNGINKEFNLYQDGSNVTGIATENAVILVNDVFQGPVLNYNLNENLGVTSITFTGAASSTTDINTSGFPIGGVILSVGSTEGNSYQPLVAAGGTAIVAAGGTIASIGLGNTGSGYRSGIQTVNVSIQQQSDFIEDLTQIGTASVAGGHVTGVAVTNWNAFYKPRDIRNVGYSSITGITTITTAFPHGLSQGDEIQLSGIAFTCDYSSAVARNVVGAAYSAAAGIMTVTTDTSHGLSVGKHVILTGLGMTCDLTAGISTEVHIYPRNRDRVYDTAISILKDGTPYTVSNAAYNPTTGVMTLTVTGNSFSNGDKIKLEDNSLTFTCAKDNHATYHTYPRSTDPYSGQWLTISNKSGDSFDVTILAVTPSTNTSAHTFISAVTDGLIYQDGKIAVNVSAAKGGEQYEHTFVSALSNSVISGGNYSHTFVSCGVGSVSVAGVGTTTATSATYTPNTGNLVLTIPGHPYTTSNVVGFDTGAITFTCGMDDNATNHAYPRSTDPIVGLGTTAITATSANTVTVNIGSSPLVYFTPTAAAYDEVSGDMVLTIGTHSLTAGTSIKLANDSLTFTCARDGHATNHAYPRSTDPYYDTAINIKSVTSTTITINVGHGKAGDQYTHTFVGVGTGAVVTGGGYTHHFIGTAEKAIISGGDYNHTFSSATAGGVTITGIGTTTPTAATYDAATGDMVLTINNHGAVTGTAVSFATGAITFTCGMDGYATTHPYPRATDPVVGMGSTAITATTGNTITVNVGTSATVTHDVTDATYNPTTGNLVLTSPNHGLKSGVSIRIPDNSLTFTCDMDGNSTKHTYPRNTDPVSNTAISIASTTANTLTVNVGTSTQVSYNVTAANYEASSGIMTMTVGSHNLTTGTSIKIAGESLSFTCDKDNNATVHKYPRKGDPYYNGMEVTKVGSATEFTVNVGVSTVPTTWKSGGKVQGAIIAPRANNKSASKNDPLSAGANVLAVLNDYSFLVNSGISTTPHFYARGGSVHKDLKVVFDEPLSYTNIPLIYSANSVIGIGSQATVDIVVGQGSSVTDFSMNNTGYGYGINEVLTVPIGGTTGIPTTSSYTTASGSHNTGSEFQLTIQDLFTDDFAGWSLGTLEVLDTPEGMFDSSTVAFQLKRAGDIISIRARKGSKINVQDTLLIFVNDILQIPGKGYTFEGGSVVTFTEAPKPGDTCKIIFYKGSGGVDVVERDIIETVKVGDDLTIGYNPPEQKAWQREDTRTAMRIDSTDIVTTNPYYGPGNSEDENLIRPVVWCRQTEDKIINEQQIGKSRELYEPLVNPASNVIKGVGIGSTMVYVESVRPFFDPRNESADATIRTTTQDKITIVNQDEKVGALASASITSGIVTAISVTNAGGLYASTPTVSIQSPVGLGSTATATATVVNGAVTAVTVSYGGTGYTSTPQVLIDPPVFSSETDSVLAYNGDSGTIVGFGTTVSGNFDKLIFDLHIPQDSYLRNTALTGTAVTFSTVDVGDYFLVRNSNLGFAQTSIVSRTIGNEIVAIGKSFFDNIYQVETIQSVRSTIPGIGVTDVKRINTKISGLSTMTFSATDIFFDSTKYSFDNTGIGSGGSSVGYSGIFTTSSYLGEYSWGKISLKGRSANNEYPFYGTGGIIGFTTSALVQRTNPLKSKNYDGQLI